MQSSLFFEWSASALTLWFFACPHSAFLEPCRHSASNAGLKLGLSSQKAVVSLCALPRATNIKWRELFYVWHQWLSGSRPWSGYWNLAAYDGCHPSPGAGWRGICFDWPRWDIFFRGERYSKRAGGPSAGNCRGDRFLFGIWSSPPEHLGSERWWSSADVFAGTGYHPHLQWGVI